MCSKFSWKSDRCLTLLALFNSYMHRTSERGIRLSPEASWLGLCGMDFFSVMPGERLFHAAFAVVLMEMGAFMENVLTSPFGSNS